MLSTAPELYLATPANRNHARNDEPNLKVPISLKNNKSPEANTPFYAVEPNFQGRCGRPQNPPPGQLRRRPGI